MGGGDAGHQRLGAVAAGHAEHVGAAGHGLLGKPAQVVARTEHDRFDAAPARLLSQVESFDLAATGSGVHEQHGRIAGPTLVPGVGPLFSDLRSRPSAWRVAAAATATSATRSSSCSSRP
jgi:hypothetical protein